MALFTGKACFSPRVPAVVQREWVEHGGMIATVRCEDAYATHVFCDGSDDPWFHSLYKRSMVIFHWSWISAVVSAQFRLPISSYLIEAEDVLHGDTTAYTHNLLAGIDSSKPCDSLYPAARHAHKETCSKHREDRFGSADYSRSRAKATSDGIAEVSLEGKTLVLDDPSFTLSLASAEAMSVAEALEALDGVSIDGVVQFLPGTTHMGKEFRCSYAH